MTGKSLPDAEQLLAALTDQMRASVGPDSGLIGIHTGGVWVAERLHAALGVNVPCASLDVSFYRDDYEKIGLHRDVKASNIPFEVEGRHLVLVDASLHSLARHGVELGRGLEVQVAFASRFEEQVCR